MKCGFWTYVNLYAAFECTLSRRLSANILLSCKENSTLVFIHMYYDWCNVHVRVELKCLNLNHYIVEFGQWNIYTSDRPTLLPTFEGLHMHMCQLVDFKFKCWINLGINKNIPRYLYICIRWNACVCWKSRSPYVQRFKHLNVLDIYMIVNHR